ncbi:hypothetical protein I597_2271 [Dokdonia donghaensis DSW-1]|nr:hypothetical protein I597_2271 [Dokdonia donghaensis DSW-1]
MLFFYNSMVCTNVHIVNLLRGESVEKQTKGGRRLFFINIVKLKQNAKQKVNSYNFSTM